MAQSMDNENNSNQSVAVQSWQYANLDNLLEQYGDDQVRSIANAGLDNSESRIRIIDISRLVASVYDNLKNGFDEGELQEYTDMVSRISSKYKDDPELRDHMFKWLESRKEFIKVSKSAAEELDQNFITVNKCRMFGSLVEILNLLNLDIYQKWRSIIVSYANDISPKLGLITGTALELVPHLRFMGFAGSFVEIFLSQRIINRVVKTMKKDKDMFEPLKKWFEETSEFEESVKNLFPYGIDKKIIEYIDNALKDLDTEEKIFSAAVVTNVIKDPAISKDIRFLAKVFLFCRSDASKEWYKRMIMGDPPSDLETAMFYFRTELHELERTDMDSDSKIEIAKCSVGQVENSMKNNTKSILGRLIVFGLSGMSVYSSFEHIRSGSQHRYSDRLRELSTNAQSFLTKMEKVRF